MTNPSPSPLPPLRLAVVGSGPAGLFAVDELLRRRPGSSAEIFERLPAPFGLVRYGVAPDHPHTRRVSRLLDSILARTGVQIHLGVEVGRTIALGELRRRFDAVILAYGAPYDRELGVPGERLPGVWTSLAFAGWVNHQPDFAHPGPLPDTDTVAVLGHGNVALDVARLLARPEEALAATDMAPAARAAIAQARFRRIVLLGRRGPAQAAFGLTELEEVAALPGWHVSAEPSAFPLSESSQAELAQGDDRAREVCALLEKLAQKPPATANERQIEIQFHRAPTAFLGAGALDGLRLERMRLEGPAGAQKAVGTGTFEVLRCGFAVTAIGHVGHPIAGAPFDAARGIIPHEAGRVVEAGQPVRGLYVVGWIKRGAKGLIGLNRRDAMETVASLLADFS